MLEINENRRKIDVKIDGIKYQLFCYVSVGFLKNIHDLSNIDINNPTYAREFLINNISSIESNNAGNTVFDKIRNMDTTHLNDIIKVLIDNGLFGNKVTTSEEKIYETPIQEFNCELKKDFDELMESFSDVASHFVPMLQQVGEYASKLATTLKANIMESAPLLVQLSKAIDSIYQISRPENVKAREDSVRKWSEYGWTMIDSAPLYFAFTPPNSANEADEMALVYAEKELEEVISYFKESSYLEDFSQAVENFRAGRYKSAALMLIMLIEKESNMYQLVVPNIKQKLVGSSSTKLMKTDFLKKDNEEKYMTRIYFISITTFLENLFEHGKNFEQEPDLFINRNYLMHGYSKRIISKTDCFKLFFALKNVSVFISESVRFV